MVDTDAIEIRLTKAQQNRIKSATGKKFKKVRVSRRRLLDSGTKLESMRPLATTAWTRGQGTITKG